MHEVVYCDCLLSGAIQICVMNERLAICENNVRNWQIMVQRTVGVIL